MDQFFVNCDNATGKPRVLFIGHKCHFDRTMLKGDIETYGYTHEAIPYDHVALGIEDERYRPSLHTSTEAATRILDDPDKGIGFDIVYMDLRVFTSDSAEDEKFMLRYATEKLRSGGVFIVQGRIDNLIPLTEMLNFRLSDIFIRRPSPRVDLFVVAGVMKKQPCRQKEQATMLTAGLSSGLHGSDFHFFDKEYVVNRHFRRDPTFLSYLYDDAEMNKHIPDDLLSEMENDIVPPAFKARLPMEPAVGHVPKLVVDGMADGVIQGEDGIVILTMGIPEKVTSAYKEEDMDGKPITYHRTDNRTYMRSLVLVGPTPGKVLNTRFG